MDRGLVMTKIVILTLLLGVASLRVVAASQSEPNEINDEPIGSLENHAGERRVETPQVVLQLKYDRGELNKIYLAQFRKEARTWVPSVPARTNLCADLCHAGLGGSVCGSACSKMLPVGLDKALDTQNTTTEVYGEPRIEVCPTLCQNRLGNPLCNCSSGLTVTSSSAMVDWSGVCEAFCQRDGYVPSGCPPCDESSTHPPIEVGMVSARILNTADGWTAWCNVQCHQGHGGAACNCDRSPLQ